MLLELVSTFTSVDEILGCNCLNESYRAFLACSAVHFSAQGYSNQVCTWTLDRFYLMHLKIKVILTFKSVTHQMKTVKAIHQFPCTINRFQVWKPHPLFVFFKFSLFCFSGGAIKENVCIKWTSCSNPVFSWKETKTLTFI